MFDILILTQRSVKRTKIELYASLTPTTPTSTTTTTPTITSSPKQLFTPTMNASVPIISTIESSALPPVQLEQIFYFLSFKEVVKYVTPEQCTTNTNLKHNSWSLVNKRFHEGVWLYVREVTVTDDSKEDKILAKVSNLLVYIFYILVTYNRYSHNVRIR